MPSTPRIAQGMEGLLSRVWRACMARLASWTQGYSGVTLSLTGILGLAAFLYGLYHYRLLRGGAKRDEAAADPNQPSTSAAAAAAAAKPAQPRAQGPVGTSAAAAATAASAASRLGGAAAVTISAPRVLFEESTAAELEDAASLRPAAAGVLRELLAAGAGRGGGPAIYVMAHVESDVGEAVVRGALEHAGLVGAGPGQLPPHRLLFCGTLEGKVSVVRQIEPDVHFDAHPDTVRELARFMKRLVLVSAPGVEGGGSSGPPPGASNVQRAASFAAYFGR